LKYLPHSHIDLVQDPTIEYGKKLIKCFALYIRNDNFGEFLANIVMELLIRVKVTFTLSEGDYKLNEIQIIPCRNEEEFQI